MSIVSDLFDSVLALSPGARITIPFPSINELKSKKTMLYNEKRAYESSVRNSLLKKSIFITEEVNTKKRMFKLHLSTSAESMEWLKGAVIVTEGGEVSSLKVTADKDARQYEDEQERIKRLQKEDTL